MTASQISNVLRVLADPLIAEHSQRFFKTGKREYGEGDLFLGIRVPVLRAQVKQFQKTDLAEIIKLLTSAYHEERLFALLLLVYQFSQGDEDKRKAIYQLYFENRQHINNWDLVDSSASQIVGAYLQDQDKHALFHLALSTSLWDRRIAIISTLWFIRHHQFTDTLELAKILINDQEDLIHKAVGWMLREIGKRDQEVEKEFLKDYYQKMPRTMLRYAIEKFSEQERRGYLQGDV